MSSAFPNIDEAIGETLKTFDTNLEPLTKDEIFKPVKSQTNKKTPGINNISAEVLKAE